MSISRTTLQKIESAPTCVDSFIATLAALVEDQTIPQVTADIVTLALNTHREKLEPAIKASPAEQAKV